MPQVTGSTRLSAPSTSPARTVPKRGETVRGPAGVRARQWDRGPSGVAGRETAEHLDREELVVPGGSSAPGCLLPAEPVDAVCRVRGAISGRRAGRMPVRAAPGPPD